MPKKIKSLEKQGITFWVSHVVEIFPSPLPEFFDDQEITSASELFRLSNQEGFRELYLNDSDTVIGESAGKQFEFTLKDFLQWQLEKMDALTIYYLIGKTEAPVTEIFDSNAEYEKDPNYSPEEWLNAFQADEYLEQGLAYIERLKQEAPKEFYKALIDAILNQHYGLLNEDWYESEIEDNLADIRQAYSHWPFPIMVISKGKFMPYIEADDPTNLCMDDFRLDRMYIRNYDEGDKA